MSKETSKRIVKIASQLLRSKKTSKKVKAVAGSTLAQYVRRYKK